MKLNFVYTLLIFGAVANTTNAQTKERNSNSTKNAVNKTIRSVNQSFVLNSACDSLSYALGVDVSKNLKNAGFEITPEVFLKGLNSALKGDSLLLSEEQNMDVIQNEFLKAHDRKNAELKKPGEDFLAKNKQRPEVKVTAEGVQYEVLKEGDGVQPTADSEVEVHYKGTLIDGTQFDSSYDRNESLKLNLNRVIEGWKIGIPLMKVGSKYKFYVPYNLAYGERATGSIPAFSALIFEVELLSLVLNIKE